MKEVEEILKVKGNFKLGKYINKQKAYLCIRKSHSNLFITLTDLKGKVIVCKTAAMVLGKLERRRRRKAPQTIEYMIASLDEYFILYNIWGIYLSLQMRPGFYVVNLMRSLQSRKIFLLKIFNKRKLPFSSTRGRRRKI